MKEIKIYDKISWHYPEGKGCPNLETAKIHFNTIMNWLKENKLLTSYGEEVYSIGVDSDFSITSDMLIEKGNNLIQQYYKIWLKSVEYGKEPSLDYLNSKLK